MKEHRLETPVELGNMTAERVTGTAISDQLDSLAAAANGDAVTLGWVLGQLHERAFGLFLLILSLPCCIPFLYGLPQVVALPLMFVSAQILIGRKTPWLPRKLGDRSVSSASLEGLSLKAGPWLRRIEALSRPRFAVLTHRPLNRIVGFALVLFSASILLPIPLTNTVPGFAIVVISVALLQRDGILTVLGILIGTSWIAALLIAGVSLTSLIKTWLGL